MIELVALPNDHLRYIFYCGGPELHTRICFLIDHFNIITRSLPTFKKSIGSVLKNLRKKGVLIPDPLDIYNPNDPFYRSLGPYLYKSVSFDEPEGKIRIIGLCDYLSQTCLTGLGEELFKILGCIPADRTYDQSRGLSDIPFDGNTKYFCYDLVTFTDRFPL